MESKLRATGLDVNVRDLVTGIDEDVDHGVATANVKETGIGNAIVIESAITVSVHAKENDPVVMNEITVRYVHATTDIMRTASVSAKRIAIVMSTSDVIPEWIGREICDLAMIVNPAVCGTDHPLKNKKKISFSKVAFISHIFMISAPFLYVFCPGPF